MVHGKARLCTEILSAGTQCTQFALRGQPWCRSHAASSQRERNADARQLIAMIRQMNVVTVACVLQNTVYELRTKSSRRCTPRRSSTLRLPAWST
jgi:hypothetical protein